MAGAEVGGAVEFVVEASVVSGGKVVEVVEVTAGATTAGGPTDVIEEAELDARL